MAGGREWQKPPLLGRFLPSGLAGHIGPRIEISDYIFDFIIPIFIALLMCMLQSPIFFMPIESCAIVISFMPMVLFSPSGIFIIISFAFVMFASVHFIPFADAGATANRTAVRAAHRQNTLGHVMSCLIEIPALLPVT
jgi:hypothetical protein